MNRKKELNQTQTSLPLEKKSLLEIEKTTKEEVINGLQNDSRMSEIPAQFYSRESSALA
jgi:hypothetical protein